MRASTAAQGPRRGAAPAARPAPATASRLLDELARAPECDVRLARRDHLRPGDTVGRYELVRELGRGGFGIVFEARDPCRGRRVALKTVRPGAPAPAACAALRRELEVGRMRHPNVAGAEAGDSCRSGPFVVMEYLSGETLAARLARGAPSVEEVVDVALAVARGLSHAHARGVLHRDLKPANVFLPSTGAPRIIDFGLASLSGRPGPRGSGTSGFMAPEQERGEPEDARTDLFALGRLVHEMMGPGATLPADRDGAHGALAARAHGCPDLDRLVAALVTPEPAGRPGSALDVVGTLLAIRRRLRAGEPEGLEGGRADGPTGRPVKRGEGVRGDARHRHPRWGRRAPTGHGRGHVQRPNG